MTDTEQDQYDRLRKTLQRELRTKHPTIYVVMDFKPGREAPTSWSSAYIMQDGHMKKLWAPWAMRRRRTDNSYYWHENSWGTCHRFLLVESIVFAAGLHRYKGGKYDGNAFHTEVL